MSAPAAGIVRDDADRPLRALWREFARSRSAVFALGVCVLLVLLAVCAPLVAPQNPYDLLV